MDIWMASDEVDMIEIDFNEFDVTQLNPYEQLGLYLLSEISSSRLRELLNIDILEQRDMLGEIYEILDQYVKED